MKRCPNCNFPNIYSDSNCFKCGTSLPDENFEESTEMDSSSVFHSESNVTAFIHTPTEDPKPQEIVDKTEEEACITKEVPLPEGAPPPLTTKPPQLPTPYRIVPKYKSLTRLGVASKLIGLVLGLVFIAVSIGLLLLFPSIITTAFCIFGVCFGAVSILAGFIISAILQWMNDVECNQRKQQELINHIYHKLS